MSVRRTYRAGPGVSREIIWRMHRLALLGLVLVSCTACSRTPETSAPRSSLQAVALPAAVTFPEGIAYDPAARALYTGSAVDGALVKIDAATGAVTTVAAAGTIVPAGTTAFPAMLGMKVDTVNRLWIAGGRTGKATVVSTTDGKILKQVTVPSAGTSLLNDVALVGAAAYITDTFAPTLWRLIANSQGIGEIQAWLDLKNSIIPYTPGEPSLNGIAVTPDGKTLIVVQMAKGLLYRIDIASRTIMPIDTGGADLSGADGLVLSGRTLYVVRQTAAEIATVALATDMSKGSVTARFRDSALAWPATAALTDEGTLYVVNTQFNTRDTRTSVTPFTVLKVPPARLK